MAITMALLVVGSVAATATFTYGKHTSNPVGLVAISWSAAITIAVYAGLIIRVFQQRAFRDRYQVEGAKQELDEAEQLADGAADLELAVLWRVTQKRLDYYHQIATAQAEKSFRHSQWATGGGFAVLIAAVALAALSNSTSATIAAGLVGTAGAALAGYLGKTFLRTQESSSAQLRSYFAQPLVFSQYLAAERLLAMIDGPDRVAAVQELIKSLAASPA
jgi:drug/metabolite transporter (DMT)-like permease